MVRNVEAEPVSTDLNLEKELSAETSQNTGTVTGVMCDGSIVRKERLAYTHTSKCCWFKNKNIGREL